MSSIRLCLRDPALRAAGLVMALQGAVVCSFAPYFSTLAVNSYGFGDRGYAILLALSSLISVVSSVVGGIRADQTANRRKVTLTAVLSLILGTGLMTVFPGPLVFALAAAVLLPVSSITFGQVFAFARLAATRYPPDQRDGIMAVIRALFAAPFVVALPLWSLAFSAGASVTLIFPVALLLAIIMLAAVLRLWPADGSTPWDDRPSGLSFRAALAEMGRLPIAARVVALGAVTGASTVYMAIISLVMIPDVARSTADVALYVGLVAGLEVPIMLLLPSLTRGMPRTRLIFIGAALYGIHVALLPVLAGSPFVWLLVLPAAIGGAVTLTVPIAYLQDLMAGPARSRSVAHGGAAAGRGRDRRPLLCRRYDTGWIRNRRDPRRRRLAHWCRTSLGGRQALSFRRAERLRHCCGNAAQQTSNPNGLS